MSPQVLVHVLAVILLVALTLGAGLQVDMERLKETLRDWPLLTRALIANVLVVPFLGWVLAGALKLPTTIATGFLLMAIAPGVPFVLSSVRKRGGHLGLAVALEAMLPLVSLVTFPITAALVLPVPVGGPLPFGKFVTTLLLFQILPLLIGIALGTWRPDTRRFARPLQLVWVLAAIGLVAMMSPEIAGAIGSVYGSRGLAAMLALVLLSVGVGWWLGGPDRGNRRVLSIGTGLRNIGLCVLIANETFRDQRITATVLSYLIVQMVVTTAFGMYYARNTGDAPAR